MKKRSRRQKAKLAWIIFLIGCGISGVGVLLFALFGCMSFGGGVPSSYCQSQGDFEATLGVIGFVITTISWLYVLPFLFLVAFYHQIRKWFSRAPDAVN